MRTHGLELSTVMPEMEQVLSYLRARFKAIDKVNSDPYIRAADASTAITLARTKYSERTVDAAVKQLELEDG